MTLRVLHLQNSPHWAGIEQHILTLMQAQREQGIRPTLGCQPDTSLARAAEARGLPVLFCFHGDGLRCVSAGTLALYRCLGRQKRFDIVHTHNGETVLMAALALKLSRGNAPVLIATQHFLAPAHMTYGGWKGRIARRIHTWVNGRVTQTIAVSEAVRQAMLLRENVPPSRISTVHNGLMPLNRPNDEEIATTRHALGIPLGALLIVTVARLEREKGLNVLLAAVPLVLAAVPQAHFVLVGDGAMRSHLAAQIAQNHLCSSIQLTGFRPDAARIAGCADVFVLPAPAEPFGLALLEAQSQGVASVATAAGGPLEIITDNVTGLLAAPNDPHSLAHCILRLLQNPGLRERIGLRGQHRFCHTFTASHMARNTLDVYENALHSHSSHDLT